MVWRPDRSDVRSGAASAAAAFNFDSGDGDDHDDTPSRSQIPTTDDPQPRAPQPVYYLHTPRGASFFNRLDRLVR